jgi:hypothetical protein
MTHGPYRSESNRICFQRLSSPTFSGRSSRLCHGFRRTAGGPDGGEVGFLRGNSRNSISRTIVAGLATLAMSAGASFRRRPLRPPAGLAVGAAAGKAIGPVPGRFSFERQEFDGSGVHGLPRQSTKCRIRRGHAGRPKLCGDRRDDSIWSHLLCARVAACVLGRLLSTLSLAATTPRRTSSSHLNSSNTGRSRLRIAHCARLYVVG